jgi:hypothetical protein
MSVDNRISIHLSKFFFLQPRSSIRGTEVCSGSAAVVQTDISSVAAFTKTGHSEVPTQPKLNGCFLPGAVFAPLPVLFPRTAKLYRLRGRLSTRRRARFAVQGLFPRAHSIDDDAAIFVNRTSYLDVVAGTRRLVQSCRSRNDKR